MAEVHKLRDRGSETEKITINLGYVDLGHIDLLVQEGFYSNRTDFIRTAIRNQLATHGEEVRKSIVRHTLELIEIARLNGMSDPEMLKDLLLVSMSPSRSPRSDAPD